MMAKKKKKQATIPGQGTPIDTATGLLWGIPEYFAEVFNRIVFKKAVIEPAYLKNTNEVEATFLRVRNIYRATLKRTRDVAKIYEKDGTWLMILVIENQNKIDFQMPFRVLQSDFINYARQISDIMNKNANMKDEKHEGEYIGGFKATDKIKPVITLVIYYGDEEWTSPLSLRDMFMECTGKYIASNYEMHLLDVKHMKPEVLNQFSPALKAFLGFLRYMGHEEFTAFMDENGKEFNNLSPMAMDALIELTGSKELKEIKEKFITQTGGIDMRNGIKAFGEQQWQQGRLGGIDEANERVAKDMLNKEKYPFSEIVELSKLSPEVVRDIAQKLKKPLVLA